MTKLLVVAGTSDSVEIVNLDDKNIGCQHFPRLPFELKGATGTKIYVNVFQILK